MQVRETDGDKRRDTHKDLELKMIDDLDFLSLQSRKQSAGSVRKSMSTVQIMF